jgi:OmpA-OmpF porin, OOP family
MKRSARLIIGALIGLTSTTCWARSDTGSAQPAEPARPARDAAIDATAHASEPDRDGDRVADSRDRCPTSGEDRIGPRAADGCPIDSDQLAAGHNEPGLEPQPQPPPVVLPDTVVDRVFFAKNEATLDGVVDALDAFAALAQSNEELTLVLIGRADESEQGPEELSRRRGDAVRSYLIRRGVPEARIQTVALGARQPRTANQLTPAVDNGAANRCVELATR